MLSLHLQRESERWAAQRQSYPAQPPSSSASSSYQDSDCESIFSTTSNNSSLSSEPPDDEPAPPAFEQPRDFNGAPITIYTSLEQAVAQSTQTIEAQGPPRRLVTPGKLYENEEDDDEIVEGDEEEWRPEDNKNGGSGSVASQHAESGLSRTVAGGVVIPVG
ncbi:hypothetical protein K445DRAFT_316874 [Daldinia sp. EC12]|nr:hypothetical protein K445DRAFT_316874 [Daldinia sp. EC12]